jgi:hypothetical protein
VSIEHDEALEDLLVGHVVRPAKCHVDVGDIEVAVTLYVPVIGPDTQTSSSRPPSP